MNALSSSWIFWALLSAIFAAVTAILAKSGVDTLNPDIATFARTVVVLFVLGGIVVVNGQIFQSHQWSVKGLTFIALSGIATALSWFFYFRALKVGNVAQVAPIDKLSVVFVALLSVIFLGEQLKPTSWIGVLLIAVGAVLLALK
ncbi:MAG: EamA family transporter [Bacteroidota bacterium]|jgi:transporter family protein